MANGTQILNKIARNLGQLGIATASDVNAVVVQVAGVADLKISYQTADIAAPLGGVSGDVSPFLGIGTANPGKIVIQGAAGDVAIANIIDTAQRAQVFAVCAAFANDLVIKAFDGTELGQIRGHADLFGLGQ